MCADLVQVVLEVLAVDELHGQKQAVVLAFSEGVDRDDGGMVQLSGHLGFGNEAVADCDVVEEFLLQGFDGDQTVQSAVDRGGNRALASFRKTCHDIIGVAHEGQVFRGGFRSGFDLFADMRPQMRIGFDQLVHVLALVEDGSCDAPRFSKKGRRIVQQSRNLRPGGIRCGLLHLFGDLIDFVLIQAHGAVVVHGGAGKPLERIQNGFVGEG